VATKNNLISPRVLMIGDLFSMVHPRILRSSYDGDLYDPKIMGTPRIFGI
jgi:hypothetical protein